MPLYVSKRTMSLLSELGDKESSMLLLYSNEYKFGFVAHRGRIKHGPTYWTDYFSNKIVNRVARFEKACEDK